MSGAVKIGLIPFSLIYLLLLVVLIFMKAAKINQTKLLLLASLRMTVQLILTGYLLTYILENQNPLYTLLVLLVMAAFSVHRVLSGQKQLNRKFKLAVALSLSFSGVSVLAFFVCAVIGKSFFDAQYTIPLSGMIVGNAMTGVNLGLKTFLDNVQAQRKKINALLNLGAHPKAILTPIVNSALETALLPTLNSMLGMGIIFLPGMMTGQILSGTVPTTAILYQIAIMIAICASVCLSVFFSLHFGCRTLYNSRCQMLWDADVNR